LKERRLDVAPRKSFGQVLREKRIAKGYSLRKFADLIKVSPTYLSHVEQDKVETPPTAERLRRMADLLGESPDEFSALAGRVADDLSPIIQSRPEMLPELLRTTKSLSPEQVRQLLDEAKRMKDKDA
jgi:transcriptional regulator with XRE-family HTH domain